MTASTPGGIDGGDSMYEQTRAVFHKIEALVHAAGGAMNDVVKMTGFITDIGQREAYLRARQPFFTGDPPASTLVEVPALAARGLLIEVEVLAIIGCSGAGPRPGKARAGAAKAKSRTRARGNARR
jgi:enamine deaminase RidA (YjgF/YER057c/UK114 family)